MPIIDSMRSYSSTATLPRSHTNQLLGANGERNAEITVFYNTNRNIASRPNNSAIYFFIIFQRKKVSSD